MMTALSHDPRIWRLIAYAYRARRTLNRGDRDWNARVGNALRRSGRFADAVPAYVAAITGAPDSDLVRVIEQAERPSLGNGVPVRWYHDLGVCLQKCKEYDAAASTIRLACEQAPQNTAWLDTLGRIEDRLGNTHGRAWVRHRLLDAQTEPEPQQWVELANQYDDLGLWMDAQHALGGYIQCCPQNAHGYKLLAKIALTAKRWGGTFTDGGVRCPHGLFHFGVEPHIAPHEALDHATELNPSNARWQAALAGALAENEDYDEACEHFQAALDGAQETDERWALGVRQRWQFQLERCYYQLGQPRVNDPLFHCTATPAGTKITGIQHIAGLFSTRQSYHGMTITGLITSNSSDHVDIIINGITARAVKVSREGYYPRFTITLKRPTIALLPSEAQLEVRTAEGEPLRAAHGFERIDLTIPHGDGRLFDILAQGGKLNKKGRIGPSLESVEARQKESLEIYTQLREFFQSRFGRDVFLMYGTLLGYYRGADFIPGDDDFDAGYVSEQGNPRAVKREAQDIIVELVRAGFSVSFNWRGRLMRVHPPGGRTTGAHVDFRPLWFERGKVWAHNHLSMRATVQDILPVTKGRLRGAAVSIPRNTEAFLVQQYGPGWKVPDPGFAYHPGDVDASVRRHLSRALITAGEYKELYQRIESELGLSTSAGRLVSLGSRDLYPLKQD